MYSVSEPCARERKLINALAGSSKRQSPKSPSNTEMHIRRHSVRKAPLQPSSLLGPVIVKIVDGSVAKATGCSIDGGGFKPRSAFLGLVCKSFLEVTLGLLPPRYTIPVHSSFCLCFDSDIISPPLTILKTLTAMAVWAMKKRAPPVKRTVSGSS